MPTAAHLKFSFPSRSFCKLITQIHLLAFMRLMLSTCVLVLPVNQRPYVYNRTFGVDVTCDRQRRQWKWAVQVPQWRFDLRPRAHHRKRLLQSPHKAAAVNSRALSRFALSKFDVGDSRRVLWGVVPMVLCAAALNVRGRDCDCKLRGLGWGVAG